jgi:hypothetical protein
MVQNSVALMREPARANQQRDVGKGFGDTLEIGRAWGTYYDAVGWALLLPQPLEHSGKDCRATNRCDANGES